MSAESRPMQQEYWPGTTIKKSTDNAFTLGYGDTPHGYVPGVPTNVAKLPPPKYRRDPKGGFAACNGTMYGLGRRDNAPSLKRASA